MNVNEILSCQFTLVSFVGNKAGVTRTDKSATTEVLAQKGARANAGRMIKNLYADADQEIRAVFSVIDAARSAHYSMTAPYSNFGDNRGPRLISNVMLMPIEEGNPDGIPAHKGYLAVMADYNRELNAKLNELEKVYDLRVQQAMANLGGLADQSDYPSFAEFRAQCGIHFGFTPVPSAGDWDRTNIGQVSSKVFDWVKERTERSCQEAATAAVRDAIERMVEPLQRMVNQTAPSDDGKQRKIFESLVGNLEDVVRNLKAFNIYNDPTVERIRCEIRDNLLKYTTAQIKSSDNVKQELHTKAADILSSVSALMGQYRGS